MTCAGSPSSAPGKFSCARRLDAADTAEAAVITCPARASAWARAVPARPGPMTPTRSRAGCSFVPVSTCTDSPLRWRIALTRIATRAAQRGPRTPPERGRCDIDHLSAADGVGLVVERGLAGRGGFVVAVPAGVLRDAATVLKEQG